MSRVPLLRPEFGPTLPELVSGRFSISRRVVAVGALIALVVVAVAIKVIVGDGRKQLTFRGDPSFNVLYDPGQLHPATPRAGELMRIAGTRRHVATEVTVRHANLPPYSGDVIGGQLPLYTTQYSSRLRTRLPGFAFDGEGKARLNQAPGYQIAYHYGPKGHPTYTREVWVMPKADQPAKTVVLRIDQTFSGRTGPRDQALVKATKKAFRSFRFGTGRPLFQGG